MICPFIGGHKTGAHSKSKVVGLSIFGCVLTESRRSPNPPTVAGSSESRVASIRDRFDIIKQTVLRNDHFSPSTLPGKDKDRLLTVRDSKFLSAPEAQIRSQLRSTKQLLGRAGERFLLFGQLGYSKEGRLCLEDAEGQIELDFSQLVSNVRSKLVD